MSAHFEGIEKRFEIKFLFNNTEDTLFSIPTHAIKRNVLDLIHCAILDTIENETVRAHLLSESSMFIFHDKIMLKTCGLTTLMFGIAPLLALVEEVLGAFEIEYALYTRRSFIFPEEQKTPHQSWEQEVAALREIFPNGVDEAFGIGDCFYVFVDDRREKNSSTEINFMEVAMKQLDPEVMKSFFMPKDFVSHEKSMKDSGLQELMPEGCIHNGFMFEPCGFSSNSIVGSVYNTVHITPEDSFSYVSFESNCKETDRESLYTSVREYFRPGDASFTIVADTDLLEDFPYETVQLTPRISIAFHTSFLLQAG